MAGGKNGLALKGPDLLIWLCQITRLIWAESRLSAESVSLPVKWQVSDMKGRPSCSWVTSVDPVPHTES